MIRSTVALLPTGTNMSPSKPESAPYYDRGQVAYVVDLAESALEPTRFRVLTSFGSLGDRLGLGSKIGIHHDQTLRRLGVGTVVGIVDFATGESQGYVPLRKVPHWVFK